MNFIVTDIAVIEVSPEGLLLKEYAPHWTAEEIQAVTEPQLIIASNIRSTEIWELSF